MKNVTSKDQVKHLNLLRDTLSTLKKVFEVMVLADILVQSETNNLT